MPATLRGKAAKAGQGPLINQPHISSRDAPECSDLHATAADR
jgi:hypothetical protein